MSTLALHYVCTRGRKSCYVLTDDFCGVFVPWDVGVGVIVW